MLPKLSLGRRAEVLSREALKVDDPLAREVMMDAADFLSARAEEEKVPVKVLEADAPRSEVIRHRRFRAVRHGDDVYLPSVGGDNTCLPNCMLRTSLFAASDRLACGERHTTETTHQLPEFGDMRIDVMGAPLGWFDRRVFSLCLDYYAGDRRLSSGRDEDWISISVHQFGSRLGGQTSPDRHRAIFKSLERLSSISLTVRERNDRYHLPAILEVKLERVSGDLVRGSELVEFRVPQGLSVLYGINKWTSLPYEALVAGRGLATWVACFYSTHAAPKAIAIQRLRELSGSPLPLPVFSKRLEEALKGLQRESVADSIAVASYIISTQKRSRAGDKSKNIEVRLRGWSADTTGQ